jgi:hypothetical protein
MPLSTCAQRPPSRGWHPDAGMALASLALLRQLEDSLNASREALLARDLSRLEQGTDEQIRLRRALGILLAGKNVGKNVGKNSDEGADAPPSLCDPLLAENLREAQLRVLQHGRVQAALLRRAQRWLRVLSNLLAGPEAGYLDPTSNETRRPWPGTTPSAEKLDTENLNTENFPEDDACRV